MRVFPLSNWTELDVWQYIHLENIPIVPLYFAAPRPGGDARRADPDHGRRRAHAARARARRRVEAGIRFRTLGCYPLTGAIESEAATLPEIIQEMLLTTTSERQGRAIDHDQAAVDGEEEAGGVFLMAARHATLIAADIDAYLASTSTRACCASSPAAASTTANRR